VRKAEMVGMPLGGVCGMARIARRGRSVVRTGSATTLPNSATAAQECVLINRSARID